MRQIEGKINLIHGPIRQQNNHNLIKYASSLTTHFPFMFSSLQKQRTKMISVVHLNDSMKKKRATGRSFDNWCQTVFAESRYVSALSR